jgi:hypothetical protein
MQKNSPLEIQQLVQQARFIQNKLNKELYIRIVNPNNIDLIWYIKDFIDDYTHVLLKYDNKSIQEQIAIDQQEFHFGLVIISNAVFYNIEMRKILYKTFVPVLKLGHRKVKEIKDVALIVSDSKDPEKISNAIFDFSEQFELNIELYNYLNESQDFKEQVIEHYYNLAVIFSKNIKVFKQEENPIRTLQKKDNFLHVVPFSKKLLRRRFYSYFSTDSDLMYHFLESYHQMFIPVDDI